MKTICIAGKNNIAVDVLNYIKNNFNHNLCVVLNKTDKGINGFQRSLKYYALEWNIDIFNLDEIYNIDDLIFLSLEFDRIIKPEKFKTKNLFNIHFSLLPEYKGMYTSALPILHGKNYSGVTLHEIDEGIDTGDIIDQVKFEIPEYYTSRDLYLKYIEEGTQLVITNIEKIIKNNYNKFKQPYENSTYFSKKSIDYSNLQIDYNTTAYQIVNQLRAFTFREYQLPTYNNKKISKWEILSEKSNKFSGLVDYESDIFVILNSIDYKIKIYYDFYDQLWESCIKNDIISLEKYYFLVEDINLRSNDGLNALLYSIKNGSYECVRFLINKNADTNIYDYEGKSAINYAEEFSKLNNDPRILDLLKV
ncbi:MAG: formyltransferase family protein [Candidatus Kapabacteria bacterium]|nr:formyltransferase family protein [Candidatus Kapabacteria bacterium]